MDRVDYQTAPSRYKHWKLKFDGPVATLLADFDENAGLMPGYKLKLNSYDLGVDIGLNDAVNRIRFERPEVRAVVIASARERVFCSGANIFMLGVSSHSWKVNFCKFTNETRNGMEDSSRHDGLKFLAALNGTTAGGSITAFYTVLTEGDDQSDPVADAARAILDGHIVLSRRIAESGQYPAIDVEASVSRAMHEIAAPAQLELARRFRQTLSTYQHHRDLIAIGAYQRGTDPRVDAAMTLWPRMQRFLQQGIPERTGLAQSVAALEAVLKEVPETAADTKVTS